MTMTGSQFATRANDIVRHAATWVGDLCSSLGALSDPISDEDLARFVRETQGHLDRLWLHGLQWEPVPPGEDDGDSMRTARVSKLRPGSFWTGRCACGAFYVHGGGAYRCDPCELSYRTAVEARRAALHANGGGETP